MHGSRFQFVTRLVAVCLALLVAVPVPVLSAEKADMTAEVLKLLKADVPQEVILAFIEKMGAPAELPADDIVTLKEAGAGEAVLVALLRAAVSSGGFPFDLDERHQVGAPATEGAIAVFPVFRKGPVGVDAYLSLDEAMKGKTIEVREKGDGSVPVVIIINRGNMPIYIAAGEVIIGGKQDRMVAYDVIVKPSQEMTVEVRCVEQGRWRGPTVQFASAGAMGGRKTRLAVQFKGQRDVWQEVATQNADLGVESSTGSYKASLSRSAIDERYQAFAGAILPALDKRNTVGMIVALNGAVHSVEIFGSPALFAKLKEKLLKASVLDVLGTEDTGASPPSPAAIRAFYESTLKAQSEELKTYEENVNRKRETPDAAANECLDMDGEVLHRSLLAK